MSSAANFLRVSGRVCFGPTDLSTEYPHGGTDLGRIRNAIFTFKEDAQEIRAEEFGGATVDYVWQGYRGALACVFREWDIAAMQQSCPNTSTGSSGQVLISGQVFGTTADTPVGSLVSDRAIKLLVSPRDPAHPGLLLYEAFPMLEESSRMQISIGADFGLAAVFRSSHKSTGETFQAGLIEDMTL